MKLDTSEMLPAGMLRMLYRPFRPLVERSLRLQRVREVWRVAGENSSDPVGFAEESLRELGVEPAGVVPGEESLRDLSGPLVVVANHPFGGIEALALMQWIERLRPGGWKMIVNRFLWQFEELRPVTLKVDPAGPARESLAGLAAARRFLREGGCVVMFPAGRVSEWRDDLDGPCDLEWSNHAARLAAAAGAPMALVHVAGQNGEGFLRIPPEWRALRTLALVRALSKPPVKKVQLKVAEVLQVKDVLQLAAGKKSGERMRALCYAASERRTTKAEPRNCNHSPTTNHDAADGHDEAPLKLSEAPEFKLLEGEGFEVLRFRGDEAPELLEIVGRGRERTFRAAGQGVGKEIDLSPEDEWYHHLVVRDRERGELIGAYRIGVTAEILQRRGLDGMYLGHVFDIDPAFYDKLGSSLELSRSFVLPEHQRDNRSLAVLWKGLGTTAVELGCRTLYGSVTISDSYQPVSRAVLAGHLHAEHGDDPALRALVKARRPFVPRTRYHRLVNKAWSGEPVSKLWPMVTGFEGGEKQPPPLIKYYTSLGAKFISFHVEESFNDALYCLMRVDLEAMPPRYRKRFMGK